MQAEVAAGTLPLVDGEYSFAPCTSPPDILTSIGIYTQTDPPNAGQQVLSPIADGVDGYCYLNSPLTVQGDVYSGQPSCESGGRASEDIGMYSFSYQVADEKTFLSNGKTYTWCAPHR